LDTCGSFTTIDVSGALYTEAYGINDSGQIVGGFYDGPPFLRGKPPPTQIHGFVDTGGSFTTFDVPERDRWHLCLRDQ
jgi:hypothetical protein